MSTLLHSLLRRTQSLPELLPWIDLLPYSGDTYTLLRGGNLLAACEVLSCDSSLAGFDQLNGTSHLLHSAIQGIPTGYAIGVHLIRRRAPRVSCACREGAPESVKFLRRSQSSFWERRRQSLYENRVILTLECTTAALVIPWHKALAHAAFGWFTPATDYDALYSGASELHHQWHSFLEALSSRVRTRPLSPDELTRLYYYFLNPYQRGTADKLSYNPAVTLARQVSAAHYFDGARYLSRISSPAAPDTHFAILSLNVPPANSQPALWASLAQLGSARADEKISEFWATQYYIPSDPQRFLMALNLRANLSKAGASSKMLASVAQHSVTLGEDAVQVIDAIQRDKEGIGQFSMQVTVYDHDTARLHNTLTRIQTEAASVNANFLLETSFARLAGFLTSLPGNSSLGALRTLNYRPTPILARNFADMALIHHDDDGDPGGAIILETPEGGIFRLDLFSPRFESWNAYFAGRTGSGKSFTECMFLEDAMSQYNLETFILDIGLSYDALVRVIPGSTKVTISFDNSDIHLNPFSFPAVPTKDDRATLANLLEYLATGGQGRLSQTNRVDINDAINATLEDYDPDRPPVLESFYKQIELLDPTLAKPYRLWLPGGPYATFFNSERDTFRDATLTYFELAQFDEHPDVAPALIFVLFNKIFTRIKQPSAADHKKLIVMDECWRFLLNPVMAKNIEELYRTIRKHGGAIHTLTQSPDDLINSPHKSAIIPNTNFFFFLEQKSLSEATMEAFGLNPRQFSILKNNVRLVPKQYSSLMVHTSAYQRIGRIRVSPHAYWMNTTTHGEKIRRDTLADKLGSMEAAVDQIVTEDARIAG